MKNHQSGERRTYVVVGATGKTGRVVERLLISHGHEVRAVARSRGLGVDDAAALERAFEHADGAFVIVPFDLASVDLHAREDATAERLEGAIRGSGVPRVVLLSGLNAHLRRGTSLGAALMEERLHDCSVPEPIVLRAGWFMENFTDGLGFRAQAENTGVFRTPFTAHRPMPTVAARDVGQRAAELLTQLHPRLGVHEIHGHADLTMTEATAILAEAAGLPGVGYEQLSYDAARTGMLASGMSPSFADAFVETARSFNDAQPWALTPRDEETTTTTSLRDWARSTLAGVPA
ncbi:NmrA family NAD(P)-binding protein [Pseudonocardia sp. TRM90224]|uniref:NmrA family NAD(P)-binding protein n=1 Tax=Pseudonocardia sp. TRM90224 TaxID=2812678 RepID=UPI003F8FA693